MKTRGIENATRRLVGARKLGSSTLLAQADQEARHALAQARAWMERAGEGRRTDDLAADENYAAIAAATQTLETMIAAG